MNTPNKLTILRIIMIPVFLVFYLCPIPYGEYIAFFVFLIASLTDTLDGHLARKNNQITDFGKFLDPLADKMLVISALVAMLDKGIINVIAVIIIIGRELMVTSVRLVASGKGKVISAGSWGKAKTVVQLIAVLVLMLEPALCGGWEAEKLPAILTGPSAAQTAVFGNILLWIAVILTVISGAEYIIKNWKFINYKQ